MVKEGELAIFINLFRGASILFLLTGLALLGYAGYELFISYLIVHNEKDIRIDGEFVDYDAEVSSITHAGGHVENRIWFPRPVFKFRNKAGVWKTVRDPNVHFWKKYKKGDRVPVVVRADDHASADREYPFARLTDAHTRYFFHGAVFLVGLVFFVLSILGWMMLRTPAE